MKKYQTMNLQEVEIHDWPYGVGTDYRLAFDGKDRNVFLFVYNVLAFKPQRTSGRINLYFFTESDSDSALNRRSFDTFKDAMQAVEMFFA